MRRPTLHALAAALLAAGTPSLLVPADAAAQRASAARTNAPTTGASMSQLMAPWELEATGVARLSAEERRALETWIGRYTAAMRAADGSANASATGSVGAARRTAPPGQPVLMDTIRPAPGSRPGSEMRPAPTRPARIAVSFDPLPGALEVVAVHDGGDVIETEDGSLWETYLPDRFNAASWQVGQQVVVRGNPLAPQLSGAAYDVVLQNGETRTAVVARYAGRQRVEPGSEGAGVQGEGMLVP